MKHLLDPKWYPELERFARRDTLLALDYDGTLAPIVDQPSQADMRSSTRALLSQVSLRFPTVIITGRARMDMMRLLAGIPSLEIIGNHGLEGEGTRAERFVKRVRGWHAQLEPRLRSVAGVNIEDKRYSLTVHYRSSPDRIAARAHVRTAAASLEGVRLIGGKEVANLVPHEGANKATALASAMGRHGCRRAIFVGDDDTDEDVFALHQPDRLLAVRVGCDEDSAAEYCLRTQAEIDEVLSALLGRRSASMSRAG